MKYVNTVTKLGCLLWCGFGAGAALAGSPNGKAYKVNVFSSFGTEFNDCFAFDTSGNLFIKGLGGLIIYRHDQLNAQPEAWQATPSAPFPGGFLSFHGTVGGSAGQTIIASGISSLVH